MDYILLTLIFITWSALGWHIKTTGDIYRTQADMTDNLISILTSPKCEEE